MAKTNRYTTINFNHIYDKNLPNNSNPNNASNPIKTSSSSSSSLASLSYSAISAPNNKPHGRMLVLTRPTHKPISIPPPLSPQPQSQSSHQPQQNKVPDQDRSEQGSDTISLRPLGRTGVGSPILSSALGQEKEKHKEHSLLVVSAKTDKFVPPHLRPGFVGREERPGPEVIRTREAGQKHIVSPGRYDDLDRPKSGGGYERMKRAGESDLGIAGRPRSSGNRPSSSGWLICGRRNVVIN
nr:uncharacterized protein LOC107417199 isoform X1 [Ziziphus jujuba var. spinosa]